MNETTRHGIIAHCPQEENLGKHNQGLCWRFLSDCCPNSSVLFPEIFGKDFPGPFCLEKSFQKSFGQQNRQWSQRNRQQRPQLCFLNFPPNDDGQRSHALRFCLRDCALYTARSRQKLISIPFSGRKYVFYIQKDILSAKLVSIIKNKQASLSPNTCDDEEKY